jgi:radical SAM protein with 4Fe4S-binding SPASM domain
MENLWDKVRKNLEEKTIPIDVVLELTRTCNLDCCHCYNIKDSSRLSFEQIKEISAQLRKAGTLFISLTGGEVFTHPDFFAICFYLKDSGFDLKLFTNGTMIDHSNIDSIEALYFSEVGISLQGADSITHDKITGSRGSFDKAVDAVKLLKSRDIPVNIKTTLMKANFGQYKDIIALAESLQASYIIDPVVSPKDDGSKDILINRISEEQLKTFYQDGLKQEKGKALIGADDFKCPAGKVMAGISAKGDVFPCIQLPEKLGNVFERRFIDIWADSSFLDDLRSAKKVEKCAGCHLLQYCSRCPGLAYLEDGDAFGISTVACINARVYQQIK